MSQLREKLEIARIALQDAQGVLLNGLDETDTDFEVSECLRDQRRMGCADAIITAALNAISQPMDAVCLCGHSRLHHHGARLGGCLVTRFGNEQATPCPCISFTPASTTDALAAASQIPSPPVATATSQKGCCAFVVVRAVEQLRKFVTLYVPAGFRDKDGVWHDGPHRPRFLASLDVLEARLTELERERSAQEMTLAACARLLGADMPEWAPLPTREIGCEACAAAEAQVERLNRVADEARELFERLDSLTQYRYQRGETRGEVEWAIGATLSVRSALVALDGDATKTPAICPHGRRDSGLCPHCLSARPRTPSMADALSASTIQSALDGDGAKHECQRCGSDTWTTVSYSGCSDCLDGDGNKEQEKSNTGDDGERRRSGGESL